MVPRATFSAIMELASQLLVDRDEGRSLAEAKAVEVSSEG